MFGVLIFLFYVGVVGLHFFLLWKLTDAVTRMSRSVEELVEIYRNKPAA